MVRQQARKLLTVHLAGGLCLAAHVLGWRRIDHAEWRQLRRCPPADRHPGFPRETVAIDELARAGRMAEARNIYRWFMPLLHLDVSARFVQNIKRADHIVRGASTMVRAPRLELEGEEKAEVEAVVAAALKTRPDVEHYGL